MTDKALFLFDAAALLHHALRQQMRGPRVPRPGRRSATRRDRAHVAFSRAVACGWDDVLVTQGAQQALDLIARVVVRPGDGRGRGSRLSARPRAFASLGATVIGVPVDAQGLVTERLPDARACHVTPSHQFPLGMPMTLDRRVALLEWAQRRRAVIIEDDYDGEFRFEGRPVESLKSLDRTGLVAYVGTFSKTIFPELRIGYAIPPRAARRADQGEADRRLAHLHADAGGACALHARRRFRAAPEARAEALRCAPQDADRASARELAPWFDAIVPTAGIHLAAHLKPGPTKRRWSARPARRTSACTASRRSTSACRSARAAVRLWRDRHAAHRHGPRDAGRPAGSDAIGGSALVT